MLHTPPVHRGGFARNMMVPLLSGAIARALAIPSQSSCGLSAGRGDRSTHPTARDALPAALYPTNKKPVDLSM